MTLDRGLYFRICAHLRCLATFGRGDLPTPSVVRCQYAVVASEIVSGAGDKRGEPGNEVSRREQQMSGAIAEGTFEAQPDSAVCVQRQAFEANCRAGNIAAQMFQAIAAMLLKWAPPCSPGKIAVRTFSKMASSFVRTMAPRGPPRVLWVVKVTTSAPLARGSARHFAATRPVHGT